MDEMNMKNGILPFWTSEKILPGDREDRVKMFEAAIYKVWAPIVQKHIERELKDKTNNGDFDFKELDVLHECDLAVHQSGYRVDRITGTLTERDSRAQEAKASVLAGAREVYGA